MLLTDDEQSTLVILDNLGEMLLDLLHTVCRYLLTDLEPYGKPNAMTLLAPHGLFARVVFAG